MNRICYRKLTPTEITAGIFTLSTKYRNRFPAPRTNIKFVDENGRLVDSGKMHSSGLTRIDGMTWWYRQHPNIKPGATIGIYKNDSGDHMIKLESAIEIDDEPSGGEDQLTAYEEDITSLSLEKDLENYLSKKLYLLEEGLSLVQSQYSIDYENNRWYIDILAKDKKGNLVVIELKAGMAKEGVCGQISKYIAVIKKIYPDAKEKKIRGIIVANEFDTGLKLAVCNMPDISLKKYNIDFRFEDILEK